ncbi:MAG: PTS sugar transporter subunit IIA [Longimicrobiaceae bacterium]
MNLTELLTPERIKVPLEASDKDGVLEELVRLAAGGGLVQDVARLVRAVRDREEVLSTGIGNGVAVPHGKCPGVSSLLLAAGVAREPIDFDALDGEPVRLFFLLVGPESAPGPHVRALSRVSRLLRRDSLRDRLAQASSPDEFHAVIAEAEAS